ncbi:hypothetical protein [Pandoraea sputorum]|nr:hypothetical protein [Pandoraea sputorum]
MPFAPISDLSLVCPSDVEEYCRSGVTLDVGWEIDAVFNVTEPLYPQTFPPVPSDSDTAFRFQSEFLGIDESDGEGVVAQWICALRHGGNTSAWRAFVRGWQAGGAGERGRDALFQRLACSFGRLHVELRPHALELLLKEGPAGRAAILRNWKQIGLGKFSREHWPLVQKLLRQAGMLR